MLRTTQVTFPPNLVLFDSVILEKKMNIKESYQMQKRDNNRSKVMTIPYIDLLSR